MKKITKARSYSNGIIFYSHIHPDYTTNAFLDENVGMHTIPMPAISADDIDFDNSSSKHPILKIWMLIIFDVLLILSSILLAVFYGYFNAIWASIHFSIFSSYKLFYLTNSSIRNKYKDEHNHTIAKFHGAEHMAINAYNKLQHIPTLEEIRKFSRFSKHCGSMYPINTTIMFILISINILFSSSMFHLLILVFILLFMSIAHFTGLFRFLQVFFVSKPTDTELLLAIRGLEEFEMMEGLLEKIKNFEDSVLHNS